MAPQIAQTASGPIEYRLEGSGPVVLVLNGGHCSRTTRLSHERLASAGFTVLTPSRPGYDATPASVGPSAQAAADALAALLDTLSISSVTVIGISAAGPTALAFAQRHPARTERLILESAMTTDWNLALKRPARLIFGRAERITWAMVRLGLRLTPTLLLKAMLSEFSTLKPADVLRRMSAADRDFFTQMLLSMRSGQDFIHDIEHHVEQLDTITAPVLVLYSPHDKSVPPANAERIAREIPHAQLCPVPADSHLIWIGPHAEQVWRTRLEFLTA